MYFDDMTVGMTVEIPPVVIEKEKMLAFAREYDNIPLHTDEEYAKRTRFGGLIAPGVMTFMTVWAEFLKADLYGDELVAGKSTHIEWLAPVYPGDRLTSRATVTALERRGTRSGLVTLTVEVWNAEGHKVLRDVTESVVLCRPA
ncbi:MAG: MaoC family dehydratase N-terminal domain-containing protein [Clostridia bacterium]|nr:MaoC family dehydratase N-terminal domain-containing protein [Clostridia bacterium]